MLRKRIEIENIKLPKSVQEAIPVKVIYDDGIFDVGNNRYSRTYRFEDINYQVASEEDKETIFARYSALLNSLDSNATTKITINNRRLNENDFESRILIDEKEDGLDIYRKEYNRMLADKAAGGNSIIQEKYITVTITEKSIEDARIYFNRFGAELAIQINKLGSKSSELNAVERLRIFYDFYRAGEENVFCFDISENRKRGHSFKDYICPDYMESKSLGKGLLKTAKGIKHAVSVLAACSGMMLAVIAVIIPLCAFMAFYGADSDDVEIDITDDTAIVAIAESQIGNKGGRPYWSWYGFNNRVDWCACFVSWCADKAGYLETGQLPRYSYCPDGINWFIQQKRWYNSNIVPKPGMIIFYDWDDDGISDHTGIVKKSEQGRVYTIEGNCRDECKAMSYPLNYSCIMGYGGTKK